MNKTKKEVLPQKEFTFRLKPRTFSGVGTKADNVRNRIAKSIGISGSFLELIKNGEG